MGTLNWSITAYCADSNNNIPGTATGDSGAFTTSTSAANVTNMSLQTGQVLELTPSQNMWVNFNGTAANGTGRFLASDVTRHFQVDVGFDGTVSAKDES